MWKWWHWATRFSVFPKLTVHSTEYNMLSLSLPLFLSLLFSRATFDAPTKNIFALFFLHFSESKYYTLHSMKMGPVFISFGEVAVAHTQTHNSLDFVGRLYFVRSALHPKVNNSRCIYLRRCDGTYLKRCLKKKYTIHTIRRWRRRISNESRHNV